METLLLKKISETELIQKQNIGLSDYPLSIKAI